MLSKSDMQALLGLGLIVFGVLLGLFLGVYICFIGGIAQIITELQNLPDLNALSVAIGVARILFAGLCGVLSAVICIIPGVALIAKS